MTKALDLTNRRFGRLVAIEYAKTLGGHRYWLCKCDCGNTTVIDGTKLVQKQTVSCGCYRKETSKKQHTTHGMCKTPIYKAWISMKNRCDLEGYPCSKYYKDRGIIYCEEWNKFENFYHDMCKTYFPHAFLDRINNDLGYSKENCRWITRKESNLNRRCGRNEKGQYKKVEV